MLSLPAFVVNDLARDLGPLAWTWEVRIDGKTVAHGSGDTDAPAASVTRLGNARTRLACAGKGTLILSLSGDGVSEKNSYDFAVRNRTRRGP